MANDAYKYYDVKIKGLSPLMMHNGQLANPMSKYAKAMKEFKGKKSEEDYAEMAEISFNGGLYWAEGIGPYVPGESLDAMIKEGARKKKLGKVFESCVMSFRDDGDLRFPLIYDGPRDRVGLFATERFVDSRMVRVPPRTGARVLRTRPVFDGWSLEFTLQVSPCELNDTDIAEALQSASLYGGLMEYRPKYGRFLVESCELRGEKKVAKKKAA